MAYRTGYLPGGDRRGLPRDELRSIARDAVQRRQRELNAPPPDFSDEIARQEGAMAGGAAGMVGSTALAFTPAAPLAPFMNMYSGKAGEWGADLASGMSADNLAGLTAAASPLLMASPLGLPIAAGALWSKRDELKELPGRWGKKVGDSLKDAGGAIKKAAGGLF